MKVLPIHEVVVTLLSDKPFEINFSSLVNFSNAGVEVAMSLSYEAILLETWLS